jgi:hypothetical protein
MEHGGQVLGPASTRFNDYTGTVAADDAEAIKDRPSLYELAMIDRDRFTIVGIDLNVDDPITATVYAVDRAEQAARESVGTAELGKAGGEIPSSRSTFQNRRLRTSCGMPSGGYRSGW